VQNSLITSLNKSASPMVDNIQNMETLKSMNNVDAKGLDTRFQSKATISDQR
jgi:hypothetical protein